MNAISLVVDSLDEPSALVPVLKELGRNHARRSIQTVHFHVSRHTYHNILNYTKI